MSTNPFDQIVNELEGRLAQLETDIAAAKDLRDRWGGGVSAASQNGSQSQSGQPISSISAIPPNAFFRMSIADAAIKLLGMLQRRLTTNEIMEGLVAGGLPPSKYNTVYSILSRRQSEEQDIEKLDKQWGLQEWSGKRKRKGPISLIPVEDQVSDIPPDPDDTDDQK